MHQIDFDSTIKGGLPVRVEATIFSGQSQTYWQPAIKPEVELEVYFISKKGKKTGRFKQDLSEDDYEKLAIEACGYSILSDYN